MRRAATPPLPARGDSGFTLLEMLVVLGITGLIAGLLYPQIETAGFAVRQRVARERVAEAAEIARAMALRSGEAATLAAGEGGTVLMIAGAGSRRIALDPAGQIRLTVRPQTIAFHPDGSTTGGELVLGSGRDAPRYVVDPASGRLTQIQRIGTGGA